MRGTGIRSGSGHAGEAQHEAAPVGWRITVRGVRGGRWGRRRSQLGGAVRPAQGVGVVTTPGLALRSNANPSLHMGGFRIGGVMTRWSLRPGGLYTARPFRYSAEASVFFLGRFFPDPE